MIISVNWLKKFTEIDGSIDELAALIGSRLVEIEGVTNLGEKYQGVVIARVVECSALEGSDHLNVTKIDDGKVTSDVERDENGLVQVVCGAPNVRADIFVAWLPPSSTVPETFSDKEPFVLGARKLRGVMSNGMLASAKELDLFDDHEGILEIDKNVAPGTKFADAYELNDYLLDIENKSLTHRPDTFGLIGFAREVAAIQGKAFLTPERLRSVEPEWIEKTGDVPTPGITIDNAELSDRYQAVVLTNVDAKAKSPLETQTYLARIGVRPHSAVVDATNYMMMLTGQPLHAFDYDKLKSVHNGTIDIHVRAGRDNEKLNLLDGREIELTSNDIVIANGETAVALAGAMGGADTEIDENTTNVLLESATFNLYNLRNTQMRHGIFSEAITRFTKGQPAALTAPVLAEAMVLLQASAKAERASEVADGYPGKSDQQPIIETVAHINSALGSKFTISDIVDTLQNVEFSVALNEDQTEISTSAPYWRGDIHIPEDVVEEVGRLNGFDTIEPTLPRRDFTAVAPSDFDNLRVRIRQTLTRAGANEVLSYSFVHGDLLQKAGQKPADSYRIVNSLSPDLQYYRQTLTPSLLNLVHSNIKNGFDSFVLYELNKAHNKRTGVNDENVPNEYDYLALTIANKKPQSGAPYYTAKKYLDYLAESLQLQFVYTPIEEDPGYAESAPFEYRRSSMVSDMVSGEYIGIVGEYKKSVTKAFKLPEYAAGSELDPRALLRAQEKNTLNYQPLSRYPGSERDICFQVEESVNYGQIITTAKQALEESELETSIVPLDIYQPKDEAFKNITIRIRLVSHQKTLNSDDVNLVINDVIAKVASATSARVV
jgi:phenylalanyl-tRNA synthetase beta chain